MVILFHEKLVGSKIRFENYGHMNTDCGFGAGDDGSGFTQLKGCIQNIFRILLADEVECCTNENEVLVEDAHLLLAIYDLINDDNIGERSISAALHVDGEYKGRVPKHVACDIRYFNVHFIASAKSILLYRFCKIITLCFNRWRQQLRWWWQWLK